MRLPLPFSRSLRPFWPAPGLLLVGKARYSLRPSSLSKTLLDTQEGKGREVSPFAPFPRPQILSIEPRSHAQVRSRSDQTLCLRSVFPWSQKGPGWRDTQCEPMNSWLSRAAPESVRERPVSTLGMAVAEVWTQHRPEPGAETETGAEQGFAWSQWVGACFGKGSLQGTLGTRLS